MIAGGKKTGRATFAVLRWRTMALCTLPVASLLFALAGCGLPSAKCDAHIPPMSAATGEQPIDRSSPAFDLAKRYEPTVRMSVFDRFWPVSVATVLAERGRQGQGVQLVSNGQVIAEPPTLADLKRSDSPKAYLHYPAILSDKADQMGAFLRGLGVREKTIGAWPDDLAAVAHRSAQIYFYDAGTGCSYGGRDTRRLRALQYWFFYALNYYPMTVDTQTMLERPLKSDIADVDFHEGDWEHITVLLEPRGSGYVPKYVWMARHSAEGKLIPWGMVGHDPADHPVVYPAFGGHPSYPACRAHARLLLAASVYDYVVCGPGLYSFNGDTTPLVDLARVSWSCWRGSFGTTEGTRGSSNVDDPTGQILVGGPPSPLRQQENKHACDKPGG